MFQGLSLFCSDTTLKLSLTVWNVQNFHNGNGKIFLGTERETSGIWMWSKPFFLKNKHDETLALFLMDTEGFFDARSTSEDCAIIFALSNLLSSVQVAFIIRKLYDF